jgi:hypothetical protein
MLTLLPVLPVYQQGMILKNMYTVSSFSGSFFLVSWAVDGCQTMANSRMRCKNQLCSMVATSLCHPCLGMVVGSTKFLKRNQFVMHDSTLKPMEELLVASTLPTQLDWFVITST